MKKNRLKMIAIALPFLVALGIFAGAFINRYRKLPLSEVLNPGFWLRTANGTQDYDPVQEILYRGNPKYKEVALTIDDGPHELYGPQILDVLRQYQVPATFFVVGVRVKACPDIVRRMVLEGHEIGNHTYDHQRLYALAPHAIANELHYDDVNIFQAAGVHTTFMRPPGVNYNDKVLAVSKGMGYVTVSWTTAAKDYLNQSPDFIVRSVVDRTENGSIILLHQDNPYTAEALPRIITALKREGYKFVTISTMLAHLNVQPYAAEQTKATAAANGHPFVLANGRTVLTGSPSGGPMVGGYIPPISVPIGRRVAMANQPQRSGAAAAQRRPASLPSSAQGSPTAEAVSTSAGQGPSPSQSSAPQTLSPVSSPAVSAPAQSPNATPPAGGAANRSVPASSGDTANGRPSNAARPS